MLGVRPESVDDIAQEAFVIAYKKLDNIRAGNKLWCLVENDSKKSGSE